MQFELANRGNVSMQIWLGKQYLEQTDHVTKEVRQLPSLRSLSSEELYELLEQELSKLPPSEAAALRDTSLIPGACIEISVTKPERDSD